MVSHERNNYKTVRFFNLKYDYDIQKKKHSKIEILLESIQFMLNKFKYFIEQ